MKKFLLVCLLVVVVIVLVREGNPETSEATRRTLTTGEVIGFEDRENTYAWKGIPFAKPPVGDLRWKAPRPPEPWQGVKPAVENGSMCAQMVSFSWLPFHPKIGSEDCLNLDVWTPRLSPEQIESTDLPVMVYIHGGANTLGMSGAIRHYRLAGRENVVVVALQYRLGLFGWLSHPAVRSQAETAQDASSNFAQLDMIAALQWVQDNIRAFGGDPGNVTIFGQSAGGFNVYSLVGSPAAKGLFHKAIAQSGNTQTTPRHLAENYMDSEQPGFPYSSRELINRLLINDRRAVSREDAKALQNEMSDSELMGYLRSKSPADIFSAANARGLLGYRTYSNVRDGVVLPHQSLMEVFTDPESYNAVPMIIGSNRDEYKFFLWSLERFSEKHSGFLTHVFGRSFPGLKNVEDYNRVSGYFSDQWLAIGVDEPAMRLSQSQPGEVFAYRFDWDRQKTQGDVEIAELIGAGHGLETVFLLGPDAVSSIPNFARAENESDYDGLGDAMRGYWAEFARTGQPGNGGNDSLPEWTAWQPGAPTKLLLDMPRESIRLTRDTLTVAELKKRLREDPKIKSAIERCELYAQLFRYALTIDFFNRKEYEAMGCQQYPVEGFEGII